MDHMKTLWGSWCVGVVEKEDLGKAKERGMKDWSGFNLFFGGSVPLCFIVETSLTNSDTGYRYATAPEGDDDAVCPAFSGESPFSCFLSVS